MQTEKHHVIIEINAKMNEEGLFDVFVHRGDRHVTRYYYNVSRDRIQSLTKLVLRAKKRGENVFDRISSDGGGAAIFL